MQHWKFQSFVYSIWSFTLRSKIQKVHLEELEKSPYILRCTSVRLLFPLSSWINLKYVALSIWIFQIFFYGIFMFNRKAFSLLRNISIVAPCLSLRYLFFVKKKIGFSNFVNFIVLNALLRKFIFTIIV